MRRIVAFACATAALAFGFAQTAPAADIPVKAPPMVAYNWTGWYVGLDGGWGHGRHELSTAALANDYTSTGGLFGGHVGYNVQYGTWVLGLEADAHWASIRGDDAGVGGTTDQTTTRFIGSVRGRAGVAWNRSLFFATAGWGFANLNHNNPGGAPADNSVDRSGFTAGAGWQYAVMENVSFGVEYRRYWLGSYDLAPTGLVAFSVRNTVDTVTGRITWRFGR